MTPLRIKSEPDYSWIWGAFIRMPLLPKTDEPQPNRLRNRSLHRPTRPPGRNLGQQNTPPLGQAPAQPPGGSQAGLDLRKGHPKGPGTSLHPKIRDGLPHAPGPDLLQGTKTLDLLGECTKGTGRGPARGQAGSSRRLRPYGSIFTT